MDDRMTTKVTTAIVYFTVALGVPVMAQPLADPTRPANYRAANEPSKTGQDAGTRNESGLTAIWSVGVKRYAMYDGRQIQVGMRLGDLRVSRITDTEVTLIGPEGRNTVSLAEGIEKSVRQPGPDPTPRRSRSAEK